MKKSKKPSKKKIQKQTKLYTLLSLALVVLLVAGIYFNSNDALNDAVSQFATHKNEITSLIGNISDVDVTSRKVNADGSERVEAKLTTNNQTATLTLDATKLEQNWILSNIELTSSKGKTKLSPFFISENALYANSTDSTPLSDATLSQDDKIFLELYLNGSEKQVNSQSPIRQAMTITDESGKTIAHSDSIASFDPTKNRFYINQGARFTSSFANLEPGKYNIQTVFRDKNGMQLETFSRSIKVTSARDQLRVRSVNYFDSAQLTKAITPEFKPSQNIYLRLNLDGFKPIDNAIAGDVDLKIENSQGKVIAYKPKFASFKNSFDSSKTVAIDGNLKLNEPDVYLLSFRINDKNSQKRIDHQERVLVKLQ